MKQFAISVAILSCFNLLAATVGQELVANGSFESGTAGWTVNNGSWVFITGYANNSTWVHTGIQVPEGAGSKACIIQAKNASSSGEIYRTVGALTAGIYRLSFWYFARSSNGADFSGGTTTVTFGDKTVATFVTSYNDCVFPVYFSKDFYLDGTESRELKFRTTCAGDKANCIDLVSLKLIAENVGDVVTAPPLRAEEAPTRGTYVVTPASRTITADDLTDGATLDWALVVSEPRSLLDTSLFMKKCDITLAGADSTLVDFPLLLRISNDSPSGFLYGGAATGGADLRFCDEDGYLLNHEIDTWDTAGESIIWVRVPELEKNTKITMYYAPKNGVTLPSVDALDPWADYVAVYHMDVDASDSDNWTVADATGNGQTGTVKFKENCDPAQRGMFGGAWTNSLNSYVQVESSVPRSTAKVPVSYSGWIFLANNAPNYATILNSKGGSGTGNSAGVELGLEGARTTFMIRSDQIVKKSGMPSVGGAVWHHWAVVFTNGYASLYVDGVLGSDEYTGRPYYGNVGIAVIGRRTGNDNCRWIGAIDEFRFRNSEISADWVKAEYENQKLDSDFVTYGAVEALVAQELMVNDAEFTLDGQSATLVAHVIPAEGKSAVCRIAYGDGNTFDLTSDTRIVSSESDVEITLENLDWATAYRAKWEVWTHDNAGDSRETPPRIFTTDGAAQASSTPVWSVADGNKVNVSAAVDSLRGEGSVTARLYATKASDSSVTLLKTLPVAGAGALDFGTMTLPWGEDWSLAVELEHVREGIGAWTNSTPRALVKIQSEPRRARFGSLHNAVDFTISGYEGAEQLRDFPLLVRLSENSPEKFHYADLDADGEGIRFADELGGLIPHEIDTWNPEGESLIWVRVPIVRGSNTKVTMYYGKTDVVRLPVFDFREVWTNYAFVSHLDVKSDWTVKESSPAAADGRLKSGNPADEDKDDVAAYATFANDGIIGGSFTNASWAYAKFSRNDWCAIANKRFTVSFWVRATSTSFGVIFSAKPGGNYGSGSGVEINSRNGQTMEIRGASTAQNIAPQQSFFKTWRRISVVYDDKDFWVVEDDFPSVRLNIENPINSAWFDNTSDFVVGQRICDNSCRFVGSVDEIRVNRFQESADWIKAEFDNVKSPAAFLVPGKIRHTGGFMMLVK